MALVSCARDAPPAIRVVALGDSITLGTREGVRPEETFTAIVEAALRAKGLDVGILNAGVMEEDTGAALARFETAVVRRKPRVVTIMYGTNDSFVDVGRQDPRVDIGDYRRHLEIMIDAALAAGITPVLMTEPRWGPRAINGLRENPNVRLEAYAEACRAVAAERRVTLVDHFADWTSAGQAGQDTGAWTVDQCHPNPDGHRRMAALLLPALLTALGVPQVPAGVVATRDLDYGGAGNAHQRLDLYVPSQPHAKALPLVVFLHGGGWSEGDKTELVGMMLPLVATGDFAGASVNYRLTAEGPHPLQVHDARGAIRWLRAHAGEYGIDPARVAVFGVSAGGHLASLVGTSGGVAELEGDVGGNRGQSSRVSCVVNFCGPSDFLAFSAQGSRVDTGDAESIIGRLLGGTPNDRPEVARAASPVTYISADDPPFLHIHGSDDDVVPIAQSREFDAALDAAGIPSTLLVGEGGGHLFYSEEIRTRIQAFLARCLLGQPAVLAEGPVAIR